MPYVSGSPDSGSSPSSKGLSARALVGTKEKPVFTLKQMTIICERMCKERTDKVREEYDQILQQKLSEQYDAFVKFIDHQVGQVLFFCSHFRKNVPKNDLTSIDFFEERQKLMGGINAMYNVLITLIHIINFAHKNWSSSTSFRTLKQPQTKCYTRKDTIFWHSFPYPFTWCAPFCCEC